MLFALIKHAKLKNITEHLRTSDDVVSKGFIDSECRKCRKRVFTLCIFNGPQGLLVVSVSAVGLSLLCCLGGAGFSLTAFSIFSASPQDMG